MIELRNLSHVYGAGTPFEKTAVRDVNLTIGGNEFIGLIGHTGSGKSTLIRHFNGLLKPTSGAVLVNGEDIATSKDALRRSRFTVGLVFQYPEYQLFEETVYKDVSYGPKNMLLSEQEIDSRVRESLAFVGLGEDVYEKSPLELSGGQKRRVAIAGVLAMRPSLLVLDEPTAGLDPRGRREIMKYVRDYASDGRSVLFVSHSMTDVARYASRVLVMCDARVVMDGTVPEVFSRAPELKAMGLAVPQITDIFIRLREKGYDVDTAVFTSEQAAKQLRRLRGGGEDA